MSGASGNFTKEQFKWWYNKHTITYNKMTKKELVDIIAWEECLRMSRKVKE